MELFKVALSMLISDAIVKGRLPLFFVLLFQRQQSGKHEFLPAFISWHTGLPRGINAGGVRPCLPRTPSVRRQTICFRATTLLRSFFGLPLQQAARLTYFTCETSTKLEQDRSIGLACFDHESSTQRLCKVLVPAL